MDVRIVLRQTESELRLHRVLYVLKYMRAMILNLTLIVLAVGVYVFFGVGGLYPMAEDTVNALRAQAAAQPEMFSAGFQYTMLIFVSTFGIAFFVWMYLSITRVKRKALKFQSVFFLIAAAGSPLLFVPQIVFAIDKLDPLFSGLAVLYAIFAVWMSVDLGIALWRVARSPDVSSFVATLDPRLTRGPWDLINKLLDLPRTPLQTWRVGCAYLMAFAGSVVVIACVVYLLSLGSIYNKLGQLVAACSAVDIPVCKLQSTAWAREIGMRLVLALIGLRIGLLIQESARRLASLSVTDVLRGGRPFVLYLRSFDSDDVILPKPRMPLLSKLVYFRPFPVRIEEELFDVTDGYLPLIAIGKPGADRLPRGGMASRAHLEDQAWQDYVLERIREAQSVVMVLNTTPGVLTELSMLLNEKVSAKTLFLFDPAARERTAWRSISDRIVARFAQAGLLELDFQFDGQPIAFYFRGAQLVQVENTNWSTTSYRTVVSSYLSERALPLMS
jgi:hypothetical protein